MSIIILVKESHSCWLLWILGIQYFDLKDHFKAGNNLSPQVIKSTLINLMIRGITFLGVSEHNLRLLVEWVHLFLLNDLNSLPWANDSILCALTIFIVVYGIPLSNNAVNHINGAWVLCNVGKYTGFEKLGELLAQFVFVQCSWKPIVIELKTDVVGLTQKIVFSLLAETWVLNLVLLLRQLSQRLVD